VNVLPIVREIRASGIATLDGIASALNARGVRAARGGAWHPTAVLNLLAREAALAPLLPTTTIVESGPYRFGRNPIYLSMFLGLIGLALAVNNLWLLLMLVPFALVIRYGVVAREEAYLERKFGEVYRGYRARVRRWL
jgi:protein-S-isoprenylcysteine O-methyltransferase Ste14